MKKSALTFAVLLVSSIQLATAANTEASDNNTNAASSKQAVDTATESNTAPLTITVEGVKEKSGNVRVAIYNSEASFQKEGFKYFVLPAITDSLQFSVDHLPIGEYAIMMFHDIDDNEELKSNLVGMPTEPWGASLLGTTIFGPPKWKHLKFPHEADGTSFTITLQ